jgi:hypothetical protein
MLNLLQRYGASEPLQQGDGAVDEQMKQLTDHLKEQFD